jgi:3'(2'), 5'-bisphosphate nucleotidase
VRLGVPDGRPSPSLRRVGAALDATFLTFGSTGAGVSAVLDGRADAWVSRPTKDIRRWAGSIALARSNGLQASRHDGSELNLDPAADTTTTAILVCRPVLWERLVAAIGTP